MKENNLSALFVTEPTNLFDRVILESEADFGCMKIVVISLFYLK